MTLKCVVCDYVLEPPRHTFCSLECVYKGHRFVASVDRNGNTVMKRYDLRKDATYARRVA